MIKPAPTRLASASRTAKRARVTSGPSALARSKASGSDRESGAAAYAGRVTKQLETTAHVTQTRDARALLKRNFKAEPPGKRRWATEICAPLRYGTGTPALRE